ncbi:MAG: TonB-dependent receptor [Acidobacteriota bacterium]
MTAVAAWAATNRQEALAQQTVSQAAKPSAQAALVVRRFSIPAGKLDGALAEFATQSGLGLRLRVPSADLAKMETAGVTGQYPREEALRMLLEGSGLSFRMGGGETVLIGLRHDESVSVAGELNDSVGMTKFTEPLLDTPQTVAVVPQFVLHDQQNHTLMDAVRNVPGISLAAGESGAQGDNLTIRGFTARNDIFLDGIRDFGSYYRDSFDFEQVDVLEGPAGVQFGRGSTGGVINQESKTPTADKFVHIDTEFGTDATRRITADINAPLSEVVHDSAFRLNVMGTEGGVAGRPYAENRRFGVAPSITFGVTSPQRLTISYFHFTESDTPDYGLPWLLNGLAPGVNRHSYFGFPDANYLKTSDDIVTLKANHPIGKNVDVHTIGRWANYPRQVQITEPQICSNASVSVPVGGYVAALPTSSVTGGACPTLASVVANPGPTPVNRNQLQIKSVEGDLWEQTELTARFKALGVQNNFAGGVEGGRDVSNPIRTSYTINKLNSVPSTTLGNPNPNDAFGGTGYISGVTHLKSQSMGVYFVDTAHLGRFFEVSGGVRWDLFDTVINLYDVQLPGNIPASAATLTAPIKPTEQKVTKPSYRAAIVFKPTQHGSVYFDYGTSFNPSAESLSLSVSSSLLAPEQNETFEVGAKYSLLRDRLQMEGAWFHTQKDNARETDPTNSNNVVLAGNQLVQGVQASAVGRMGHGTDLLVGYAYLDSKVLYSKLFPTSIGYQLANVPRQTFNAFVTHNLPLRLNLGFGGNYVAARTASSTVPYVPTSFSGPITFAAGSAPCSATAVTCYQVLSTAMKQVPGYWVFNAMLKRPVSDRLELQVNVYNMLNRFYIDQPHPSHLIPGAGLSALIGVNYRF